VQDRQRLDTEEVGYVGRVLVVACLVLVAVGVVALAQTSLNAPLRTVITPSGPVYLVDNMTGVSQSMVVFSFSGAVTLASEDIIVFGGGQVGAIYSWGGGLLVCVIVDVVPQGTVQLSLVGANAKRTLNRVWFAPAQI
jgi:hypothetical protein